MRTERNGGSASISSARTACGSTVEVGTGLDGDQAVDCTGQSVLPGMFDCHVHLTDGTLSALEWESEPFSLQFYQAARNMELTLAAG
jgi:imidazolonepropionase-like amidohydrolase